MPQLLTPPYGPILRATLYHLQAHASLCFSNEIEGEVHWFKTILTTFVRWRWREPNPKQKSLSRQATAVYDR